MPIEIEVDRLEDVVELLIGKFDLHIHKEFLKFGLFDDTITGLVGQTEDKVNLLTIFVQGFLHLFKDALL